MAATISCFTRSPSRRKRPAQSDHRLLPSRIRHRVIVLPARPLWLGGTNLVSAALLALLWQFGFDGVGEEFLAVGASPGWRPCEEVEDGLPDGRHARLWRRSPDSFFSVPLL